MSDSSIIDSEAVPFRHCPRKSDEGCTQATNEPRINRSSSKSSVGRLRAVLNNGGKPFMSTVLILQCPAEATQPGLLGLF